MKFRPFQKVPRLTRDMVITEKLDGTNASVFIEDMRVVDNQWPGFADEYAVSMVSGSYIFAGSRKRWITPENDNFGFAKWVKENCESLFGLGAGHHFGEWWGKNIQRGYDLDEKRFSLFNVNAWDVWRPACCHVVPVLYRGTFDTAKVDAVMVTLYKDGSAAAPGYQDPEGVMVYHSASNSIFKKTFDFDQGKWAAND